MDCTAGRAFEACSNDATPPGKHQTGRRSPPPHAPTGDGRRLGHVARLRRFVLIVEVVFGND